MRKEIIITVVAGFWLVSITFFLWGTITVKYQVWPWKTIDKVYLNISDFLKGHPGEPNTTALQKLKSDFGGIPYRFLIESVPPLKIPEQATPFRHQSDEFLINGYHTESLDGYVLVSGAFNINEGYNRAVVLFTSEGEYIRHWPLLSVVVGVAIDFQENALLLGDGFQKIGWCDDEKTLPNYNYKSQHHSIEIAPDGTYWTNDKDNNLIQLNPKKRTDDGKLEVLRTINIVEDLVLINNEISPLTTRYDLQWDVEQDPQKNHPVPRLLKDPFHHNDVSPFVDQRFQTSLGYALLISIREQNLLLAVDPETKKILWYRQGLTERQHDVEYFDGSLYVYDNGPFRGYSRLVRIEFDDPNDGSFGIETVIDGREFGWFDPSRGQHHVFRHDEKMYHMLVNDRQGKLYIFDENQELVFALQNYLKLNGNDSIGMQLRTGLYISKNQYDQLQQSCD